MDSVGVGPEALSPPPQGGSGRVANCRQERRAGGEGAAGGGRRVGGWAGGIEDPTSRHLIKISRGKEEQQRINVKKRTAH